MNIIPLLNQDTKRFKTNSFPDPKEPPHAKWNDPKEPPTCEMRAVLPLQLTTCTSFPRESSPGDNDLEI